MYDMIHSLDQYQRIATTTALYPEALSHSDNALNYCLVGLAGECGEVLNKWQKFLRIVNDRPPDSLGRKLSEEEKVGIAKELGGTLYYLAMAAYELGYSLSEIAEANANQLADRKARGVIQGSGDDR